MSDDTSPDASPDQRPAPLGDGAAPAPLPSRKPKGGHSFFKELPVLVAIALGLALLIKAFALQAFYIPSGSMQTTLELNDRVLVNKVVYRFKDISRGDIVVFNGLDSFTPETTVAPPGNALQEGLRKVTQAIGVGPPGEKDFIKRVIAVEGDVVSCCSNGKVVVRPAGGEPIELDEPYIFEGNTNSEFCAGGMGASVCPPGAQGITVPKGRLWVMGDHREASQDSRFYIQDSNQGTVPVDKVIGRAFVVVWPIGRSDVLSRPDEFADEGLASGAVAGGAAASAPYALGVLGVLPVALLRRRARRG